MDPLTQPGLLEREGDLATLRRLLERAAAGDGQMVFVGGEAGVGKTSLVRRFASEIAPSAQVISVSCDGLSTPEPLGPILDAAPQLGLDIESLVAGELRLDRVYRAVMDAFDPNAVTVVIGENAHWTDEASIGMLRFYARHLDNRRLLVVITFRDDELGTAHPLLRLLGDLAPDPRVHRISLRPLSAETVCALAATSGLDPVELFERTGGNPFYVSEVLALGGDGVPPTVRDAVLARASRLSPSARAVLETASVLGSRIDLDLLTCISGPAITEVEECLACGLLTTVDDELAFRHELARDAIQGSIVPPRRRLIHAAVLAALRQSPRRARTGDARLPRRKRRRRRSHARLRARRGGTSERAACQPGSGRAICAGTSLRRFAAGRRACPDLRAPLDGVLSQRPGTGCDRRGPGRARDPPSRRGSDEGG